VFVGEKDALIHILSPASTDLWGMKALLLEQYHTPYRLVELPVPVAGPRQVLVKIVASAINPLDVKIKDGQAGHAQTKLPAILGIDMAGIVEVVGDGLAAEALDAGSVGFRPGDEVYGMTGGIAGVPGSLAEYAAVDADLLALKPKNLSMRQAAALPLVFITAWEALVDRAQVSPGKTVLIHGGAGGVGHIAVQLAVARGARVFATVVHGKNELIEGFGATPSIIPGFLWKNICLSIPGEKGSILSSTRSGEPCWMHRSRPRSDIRGMWSASWVGVRIVWPRFPFAAPPIRGCSPSTR
jgi:D-arabinose 1-dehydrogenase-like Zn-dependent alcohol dehydrogenase